MLPIRAEGVSGDARFALSDRQGPELTVSGDWNQIDGTTLAAHLTIREERNDRAPRRPLRVSVVESAVCELA